MDSNTIGDLAELNVAADLTASDYNVSIPLGDELYDIVAEKDGVFYRVQVKVATARNDRNSAQAQIKRSSRDSGNGEQRLYSKDAFDVLAVWAKPYDSVAYKVWDEPVWSFTVRDEKAANGCGNVVEELTMNRATERLK